MVGLGAVAEHGRPSARRNCRHARAAPTRVPGRSRANGPTMAPRPTWQPSRWLKARISAPRVDADAGAEHDVRADRHVRREARVGAQEHGLGRGHGDARLHRRGAQAALHRGLGLGQFGARVDAAQLVERRLDGGDAPPVRAGQRDDVGQVVFGLARCRCGPRAARRASAPASAQSTPGIAQRSARSASARRRHTRRCARRSRPARSRGRSGRGRPAAWPAGPGRHRRARRRASSRAAWRTVISGLSA